MLLLLAALLALALVPAFLPRRWALFGYGSFFLIAGLIALEQHVQPSWQDGDRTGIGSFLIGIWMFIGAAGFVCVLLRKSRGSIGKSLPALWPLPVGVLLAVFVLHWLSNHLAGAGPAWLVHLAVLLVALLTAYTFWFCRSKARDYLELIDVGIVAALALVTLVTWAAIEAYSWSGKARKEADGEPYCVLTFAGRDHPRAAKHFLELSSLVSRSGGRSFIDDAYWLVVSSNGTVTRKRWRSPWGDDAYWDEKEDDAPCEPTLGGNLKLNYWRR